MTVDIYLHYIQNEHCQVFRNMAMEYWMGFQIYIL